MIKKGVVSWDITSECNLRCKHCYNGEKYFRQKRKNINYDEAINILKKLKNSSYSHIHFLGGEPLIVSFLPDLVKEATKLGFTTSINTNGTLLTKKNITELINNGLTEITLSLDGMTQNSNDFIRGDGVFNKVLSNIALINEAKKKLNSPLPLLISYTLTSSNISSLNLLPSFLIKNNINLLILSPLVEGGYGEKSKKELDFYEEDLLLVKLEEFIKNNKNQLRKVKIQLDYRPKIIHYFNLKYSLNFGINIKNSYCSAGDEMIYIESDGTVYPCNVHEIGNNKFVKNDSPLKIGAKILQLKNIEEVKKVSSFQEIKKIKKNFLEKKSIEICKKCEYQEICLPCPVEGDSLRIKDCSIINTKFLILKENLKSSYLTDIKFSSILLNEIGQEMIKTCFKGNRIDHVAREFSKQYDVEFEEVLSDLLDLVLILDLNKIIKIEPKKSSDIIEKLIDEEMILLNPLKNQSYKLNKIAKLIWDNLTLGKEKTLSLIETNYKVKKPQLSKDYDDFLDLLISEEVLL